MFQTHSAAACQALLAADAGSVVIWGNAEFGADSSAMQTQLKNVQQIQASDGAFAAILDAEGSVDSPGMLLLRSYVLVFGVDLACPEQSWWGASPACSQTFPAPFLMVWSGRGPRGVITGLYTMHDDQMDDHFFPGSPRSLVERPR